VFRVHLAELFKRLLAHRPLSGFPTALDFSTLTVGESRKKGGAALKAAACDAGINAKIIVQTSQIVRGVVSSSLVVEPASLEVGALDYCRMACA
jgi:hypothetical protein